MDAKAQTEPVPELFSANWAELTKDSGSKLRIID